MNLIEQLFGVSPDGGNGVLELLLFLIPLVALAAVWIGRRAKARN
jgi:hypothetical protein